jgi:hypothetical protein
MHKGPHSSDEPYFLLRISFAQKLFHELVDVCSLFSLCSFLVLDIKCFYVLVVSLLYYPLIFQWILKYTAGTFVLWLDDGSLWAFASPLVFFFVKNTIGVVTIF